VGIAQLRYVGAILARSFPAQSYAIQFLVEEDNTSCQEGAERYPIGRLKLKGGIVLEGPSLWKLVLQDLGRLDSLL